MQLNTHELAWAAGFHEGEGCVLIKNEKIKRKSGIIHTYRRLCMQIAQSSLNIPYVLERFKMAVGGLGRIDVQRPTCNSRLPMYKLTIQNKEAQQAISLLWPFLGIVKREQIRRVYNELDLDIPGEPTRHEQFLEKYKEILTASSEED